MANCICRVLRYSKLILDVNRGVPVSVTSWNFYNRMITYRNTVAFSTTNLNIEDEDAPKKGKVSKAMQSYLQRAKEHDEFIKEQLYQYNIGKRHLANMMGEDPETFTQDDIDKAIEYLFPSGLFQAKARPLMKHPDAVFPPRKAAEFDETGRPHHFLFYTGNPNFYQWLFDIVSNINSLNDFEDKMTQKHLKPDSIQILSTAGTVWLSKTEVENILVEKLNDREYDKFISALERLLQHPYSYRVKDFIWKFRKAILSQASTFDILKPQYDADGRAYVTTKECLRKSARGEVTVRSPGTGKITINNHTIEYFENIQDREQVG